MLLLDILMTIILTINSPDFEQHTPDIYPTELQLNKANACDKETTAMYRLFLKHCTLTYKAVGTTCWALSKPPQGPELCPL